LNKGSAAESAKKNTGTTYPDVDSLQESIQKSLQRLVESFDAAGGVILWVDPETKRLSVLATYGAVPGRLLRSVGTVDSARLLDGRALEFPENRSAEPESPLSNMVPDGELKSAVEAPIWTDQVPVGRIAIFSEAENRFSDRDKELLGVMASGVKMIIVGAQNMARMKRMSDTRKALLDVSVELQHALPSEEIGRSVVEKLVENIPCKDVMLYLYNPRKKTLWPGYATGEDTEAVMAEGEFPLSEAGLAGAIMREGKAVIIPDTMADGRGRQIEGTSVESTSMLGIPLFSRGNPIGIIEMHRDMRFGFTQEELETASLFAHQAAAALENSQLLAAVERERDRAKLYLDLLSHDIANLNTPLHAYFEMLLRSESLDEASRKLLQRMQAQVDKTSALLARVRKLSKGDLDEQEDLRPVSPVAVLRDSIQSLIAAFPNKKITVNLSSSLDPDSRVMAGEMLDECFLNVLHNAAKFDSSKEPVIDVSIEKSGDGDSASCLIKISDRGCGVPDASKRAVFEKLKPGAAASFARGFGIGLNTCRKLLEKYGGTIRVEDRVKGDWSKGACFVIALPMAKSGLAR
jgi:signal transduction histidine kinase